MVLRNSRTWLLVIFCLSMFTYVYGGVTVHPKHVVFDATRRSIAVTITNSASGDYEVAVDVSFGYAMSDDSGKVSIVSDSTLTTENSASEWIKPYPQRFLLPPGENQVIRLVAYPPSGLSDGEYWARLNLTLKPRQATVSTKAPGAVAGGIMFIQKIGVPVYFRAGKVSTGVQLTNLEATASKKEIQCSMNLERTGTAAYLGVRTIRLKNDKGEQVANSISNVSVFKKFFVRQIFDRGNIPPGKYTVEVEISSSKRSDLDRKNALLSQPVRASTSVVIP